MKSQIEFNITETSSQSKHYKNKSETNFIPKFASESPYERHLKEFVGASIQSNEVPNSSIGHISTKKVEQNNFDRKQFSNLNYKEKRLLDVSPNLTPEEIQTHIKQNEIQKQNEQSKKDKEVNSKKGQTARETLQNNLNSDIFGNKKKNQPGPPQPVKAKKEEKKNQNEEKKIKSKPKGDLQGWSYDVDWRQIDSQKNYFDKREE